LVKEDEEATDKVTGFMLSYFRKLIEQKRKSIDDV
jgi:hypothetical protein